MYDVRMLFVFTRDVVSRRFGTEELACFARRVDSEWRELVPMFPSLITYSLWWKHSQSIQRTTKQG